jgi:hypothetical protein
VSFQVPESARVTDHPVLGTTPADGNNGAFDIASPDHGWRLALIASDGTGAPELEPWEPRECSRVSRPRSTADPELARNVFCEGSILGTGRLRHAITSAAIRVHQ